MPRDVQEAKKGPKKHGRTHKKKIIEKEFKRENFRDFILKRATADPQSRRFINENVPRSAYMDRRTYN